MIPQKSEKGYNGNISLKKQRTKTNWTPEQIQEFLRCKDDPIYFAENYIYITHVDHGKIKIDLYDYQREIITTTYDNRNTIVLTGRQQGKTTTAVCIILHYILFNEHKTVALLANKLAASKEILDRIQLAYENLPKWIQQGVINWSKTEVELENGCKVIASATSGSAIRGKSCVGGKTKVNVRNKLTGEITFVCIGDLPYHKILDTNILINTETQIWDGEEFRDFAGILVQEKELFLIESDTNSIEATSDHLFLVGDTWVLVEDILVGDYVDGIGLVKSKISIGVDKVYDPLNVNETNRYWTNGAISHNCSLVYIDEAAFVHKYADFFTSVYPTISSGKTTKLLLTSTPNGLNHFYDTWTNATNGSNKYGHVKATWERVPGRDEEWKLNTLRAMNFDYEKFSQEYDGEFIGSSGTLVSGAALKRLKSAEPISNQDGLSIYEKPVNKTVYMMVCDVSHGKGLDYSAFHVIDVSNKPYKSVCTYRNNSVTPSDYANIINNIGRYYNNAFVLVENNDIGSQTTWILFNEYEYENMLSSQGAGRNGKKMIVGVGDKSDYGIRMTTSVKKLGCSILKLLVEQDQLTIIDKDTIAELMRFSKKRDSYAAEDGVHDDTVMPLISFAWATTTDLFKEFSGQDSTLRMSDEDNLAGKLLGLGVVALNNSHVEDAPKYVKFDGDKDLWIEADIHSQYFDQYPLGSSW